MFETEVREGEDVVPFETDLFLCCSLPDPQRLSLPLSKAFLERLSLQLSLSPVFQHKKRKEKKKTSSSVTLPSTHFFFFFFGP